jgi:hypothetical protein
MKPYSLQAPEDIAKEYGGDKRKIEEAVRFQLIDPTAAVLAGMFIDRIRAAEAAERQNAQTVAADVFGPKTPPTEVAALQNAQQQQSQAAGQNVGLGATPQAAQMQAAAERFAPRQSVAGVEEIPIDKGVVMPTSGAAGGGLVAFAGGGNVPGYANGVLVDNNNTMFGDYTQDQMAGIAPSAANLRDNVYGEKYNEFLQLRDRTLGADPNKQLQDLFSDAAVEARGAAMQKAADERAAREGWLALTMGAFKGLGQSRPTTGNRLSDVFAALGDTAAYSEEGIREALKRRGDVQDKVLAMKQEAPFKSLEAAARTRQELSATLAQAIASGDKELELQAKERIAELDAEVNRYKADAAKAAPNPKILDHDAQLKNLMLKYMKQYGITNPADISVEDQVRLNAEAWSLVDVRDETIKAIIDAEARNVDNAIKRAKDAADAYAKTYNDSKDSTGYKGDATWQNLKTPGAKEQYREQWRRQQANEAAAKFYGGDTQFMLSHPAFKDAFRSLTGVDLPGTSSSSSSSSSQAGDSVAAGGDNQRGNNTAFVTKVDPQALGTLYSQLDANPDKFISSYRGDDPNKIVVFNTSGRTKVLKNLSEAKTGDLMLGTDNKTLLMWTNTGQGGKWIPVPRNQ